MSLPNDLQSICLGFFLYGSQKEKYNDEEQEEFEQQAFLKTVYLVSCPALHTIQDIHRQSHRKPGEMENISFNPISKKTNPPIRTINKKYGFFITGLPRRCTPRNDD